MRLTTRALDQVAPRALVPMRQKQMATPGPGFGMAVGSVTYGTDVGHSIPLTAKMLRTWAEVNVWIAAAVEMRASNLADAEFTIGKIDPKLDIDEEALALVRRVITRPNPEGRESSHRKLVKPVAHDIMVLDKGVMQLRPDNDHEYILRHRDGSRLTINADWDDDKRIPMYYFDRGGGEEPAPLGPHDAVVIQSNPVTYAAEGLAPLRTLYRIIQAEWDSFRRVHILQKTGNPAAILKMPNASVETIETIKDLFLSEMAGKSGLGFADIPADSDLIEIGSVDLQKQGLFAFYDMLIRAIGVAFRIPTVNLNWLQDVNRATSLAQADIEDAGHLSLLRTMQSVWNTEVIPALPKTANIGLKYTRLQTRDAAIAMKAVREMAGQYINPIPINQMLEAAGYEKIMGRPDREQQIYDYPTIQVGKGIMWPAPWLAENADGPNQTGQNAENDEDRDVEDVGAY